MKKLLIVLITTSVIGASPPILPAHASTQGVAIQRVITNTRSELGQLASSTKAREISELMKKFDAQYQTWNASCGGESFDPEQASDACKAMADQMRETGIALYGKLSEYLPDVAARYEQGAKAAKQILESRLGDKTPRGLYTDTMEGISDAPTLGELSQGGDEASPFDLEMDGFPDPTEKMFAVLEKLVPDFGKQIPEAVRAGNAHVAMMKKAKRARYLAEQFEKAKFVLESQREYGEIVFSATKAVSAMPQVLGIQYTGTRLTARPNQKVLEYFRNKSKRERRPKARNTGGFDPRT